MVVFIQITGKRWISIKILKHLNRTIVFPKKWQYSENNVIIYLIFYCTQSKKFMSNSGVKFNIFHMEVEDEITHN